MPIIPMLKSILITVFLSTTPVQENQQASIAIGKECTSFLKEMGSDAFYNSKDYKPKLKDEKLNQILVLMHQSNIYEKSGKFEEALVYAQKAQILLNDWLAKHQVNSTSQPGKGKASM